MSFFLLKLVLCSTNYPLEFVGLGEILYRRFVIKILGIKIQRILYLQQHMIIK